MNNQKLEQVQEQELINPELVEKFDGDLELVQEFMSEGYTVQDLQASNILHPTKLDPAVFLGNECIGFWID